MGRSRLAYRSKHRGILSENSRREIREAHAKRHQEENISSGNDNVLPEEVEEENDRVLIKNDPQEVPSCDVLTLPKLYIRECEISDYAMQIDLQDRQQSILFPVCSGELDDN